MSFKLKAEDFHEVEFSYIFTNQTSGTQCFEYQVIDAISLHSHGLSLKVPKSSCAIGHTIILFVFEGNGAKIPKKIQKDGVNVDCFFMAIAKVENRHPIQNDEERVLIEIRFSQFESDRWDDYQKIYEKKQDHINNLFKVINGDDN